MKILVVTGGIGSGKSEVCRYFHSKGIPIYDSDSRAKALYDDVPGLLSEVEKVLGCRVTDAYGKLDKPLLASVVFSDVDKLAALESVVHPALVSDFERWAAGVSDSDFVVFESAIILEKPRFRNFGDYILLVDAPLEVRMHRACFRDRVSMDLVRKRMSSQKLLNDISEKTVSIDVDYVIVNDSDLAHLYEKADIVFESVMERAKK